MSRTVKIRIVLVIAISFFVPVHLAYSHYYVLSEADFLSPGLNFESTDPETSCLVDHHKLELADSGGTMTAILPQIDVFNQSFSSSSRSHLNNQKAPILRC